MDDAAREKLLRRVNRQGATVGASLPETVSIGDDELPLAEFVIETRKVPGGPPEHRELLTTAKKTLRNERGRRLERLESEPVDLKPAETLADEIVGIDRALNALENIRKPDYGETPGRPQSTTTSGGRSFSTRSARLAALDEPHDADVVALDGLVRRDCPVVDDHRHRVGREVKRREQVGVGGVLGDVEFVGVLAGHLDGDVHGSV